MQIERSPFCQPDFFLQKMNSLWNFSRTYYYSFYIRSHSIGYDISVRLSFRFLNDYLLNIDYSNQQFFIHVYFFVINSCIIPHFDYLNDFFP